MITVLEVFVSIPKLAKKMIWVRCNDLKVNENQSFQVPHSSNSD